MSRLVSRVAAPVSGRAQKARAAGSAVGCVTFWRAVRLRDGPASRGPRLPTVRGWARAHRDPGDASVTRHDPAVGPIGGVVECSSPCCRRSRMLAAAPALAEGGLRRCSGVVSPTLCGRGRAAASTAGDRGRRDNWRGRGNRVHRRRCGARVQALVVELRVLSLHGPQSPAPRWAASAARGAMLRKRQFGRSPTTAGLAALAARKTLNRIP